MNLQNMTSASERETKKISVRRLEPVTTSSCPACAAQARIS